MFLNSFDNGFRLLLGFLIGAVALSIGLIAVLIPLNLLLVKMQWGNMAWLHESVEYALYVGVFLGAPWVLRQGAHVRVDVVRARLTPRGRAWVELYGTLLLLLPFPLCCWSVAVVLLLPLSRAGEEQQCGNGSSNTIVG